MPLKTQKKTMWHYIALYAGPTYTIYYHYTTIIIINWITFLFAPLIPMLFVIAFLALVCFYVTERILVAYHYRAPLNFDS